MFKKLSESFEKAAVRESLRKGELACPKCGAKNDGLPDAWEELLECKECGARAALIEWAAFGRGGIRKGRADAPPPETKIRKMGDGLGGFSWEIPAAGKFGSSLYFAILWLLVCGFISGGFMLAFFSSGEISGDSPEWLLVLFFGVFWLFGFGALYSAVRKKFLRHRVEVSGGDFVLTKMIFGREKSKSLPISGIKTVSQKEFYKQNYEPVYGIEIRGDRGKIRFGTTLTEPEKAWLVADLSETIFGQEPPKTAKSAQAAVGRKDIFSIPMPRPPKYAWLLGAIFTLIAIGFFCIGIFAIEGEPWPEKSGGVGYVFELVFSLFGNGFRTIWLLLTTAFCVLGIYTVVNSLRGLGQDRKIEGNSAEIAIRTYKHGLILKEQSFPRAAVSDIRTSISGSSGSRQMKRIDLIVDNKVEKLCLWVDGEEADRIAAEVRGALGV